MMENNEKKNVELDETELEKITGGTIADTIRANKELAERCKMTPSISGQFKTTIVIHEDVGVSGSW